MIFFVVVVPPFRCSSGIVTVGGLSSYIHDGGRG